MTDLNTPAVSDEALATAGEVWQESDNVLLLCIEPGKKWLGFGDRLPVPWDAPNIARPLRRMLDTEGNIVPEYLAALPALTTESRADWERDVLDQFLSNVPTGNEAGAFIPDFIAVLTASMLAVRGPLDCTCGAVEYGEMSQHLVPCPLARDVDAYVHWVGEPEEGPTSLHGNGAASFVHTSGDEDEVTCSLCLSLLHRTGQEKE